MMDHADGDTSMTVDDGESSQVVVVVGDKRKRAEESDAALRPKLLVSLAIRQGLRSAEAIRKSDFWRGCHALHKRVKVAREPSAEPPLAASGAGAGAGADSV